MMTILHLSDTHGLHHQLRDLPPADVIVHSGDVSMAGTEAEVLNFLEWFIRLPYKYKIFVAGNHDDCLDGETIEGLPDNCHYLCNNGVTVEGVRFWGVPFFFSDDVEGRSPALMQMIPPDTDVLITHRPPFGILDRAGSINFGCPDMLDTVRRVRPRLHLFGHIHDAYGIKETGETIFVNGSLADEQYRLRNKPHLLEL